MKLSWIDFKRLLKARGVRYINRADEQGDYIIIRRGWQDDGEVSSIDDKPSPDGSTVQLKKGLVSLASDVTSKLFDRTDGR